MPEGLARLHADLVAARSTLEVQRCGPQRLPGDAQAAAADLLASLEAYAAGLSALGMPVPPVIRDELRLRRRLSRPAGAVRRPR